MARRSAESGRAVAAFFGGLLPEFVAIKLAIAENSYFPPLASNAALGIGGLNRDRG